MVSTRVRVECSPDELGNGSEWWSAPVPVTVEVDLTDVRAAFRSLLLSYRPDLADPRSGDVLRHVIEQCVLDFIEYLPRSVRAAIDPHLIESLISGAHTSAGDLETGEAEPTQPSPPDLFAQPAMKSKRDEIMQRLRPAAARFAFAKRKGAPRTIDTENWYRETIALRDQLKQSGVKAALQRAHETKAAEDNISVDTARTRFDEGKRLAGAVKRSQKKMRGKRN